VQYVAAIRATQTRENKQPRPIFLVGISWGGLLATAVAKQLSGNAAGLILVCPGFFSRKGTSQTQHNAVKLATLAGLGGLRFPVPLRDPELFTRSADWRAYIADDPFTLRRVTLRLATASAKLYRDTVKAPVALSTPTLLMLGGMDLIIHNDQVSQFVKKVFGQQTTLIEYPNAAHTLEFEDDTAEYLADLADWCHKRV
jgi:alpha-beta hydrolase superfamily lysophospholipase